MKNILIYFSAILFLSSCFQERIELDLNEGNSKIAIVAWINDLDEDQFITVRKSANYLGNEQQEKISNAICLLDDGSQTYTLIERQPGVYFLPEDWVPVYDQSYSLDVRIDDVTYSASSRMRSCPQIENPDFLQYTEGDYVDSMKYLALFSFQETPGEGDAYYAINYLKGSTDGESLRNGGFANDDFVDGEYFEDIVVSEDENRLFNPGDTVVFELFSIGLESNNYLMDIESEIFRGSPFDAPPANVRSNFNNGAVGYFIMSGGSQVEEVLE